MTRRPVNGNGNGHASEGDPQSCARRLLDMQVIERGEQAFREGVPADPITRHDLEQIAGGRVGLSGIEVITYREMAERFPSLRPVIIGHLLRAGETMNVIAASKVGKSWLVIDLALAFLCGMMWLGTFQTHADGGDVMVIDNELHTETLQDRIGRVARARGLFADDFADRLTVVSLRGHLKDLYQLKTFLDSVEPGRFKLIVIDAWYRALPVGTDENDNAAVASLYNLLDAIADRLGCGIVIIHHASKGAQGGKSVTDVGAGAGSQSRAVDTHFVVRPHEEPGVAVVDLVSRSFAPHPPFCIRYEYPIWDRADGYDPALLKLDRPRRNAGGVAAMKRAIAEAAEKADKVEWTPATFATTFVTDEPQTASEIYCATDLAKITGRQAKQLLEAATAKGLAHRWTFGPRNPVKYSTRQPDLGDLVGKGGKGK